MSLAGAATSIIFVATSTLLSRLKTCFVATNTCLCLSHFVTLCLSRQIFVVTEIVATEICFFCRDKHTFVATKHLSRQTGVCRDKIILVADPASDITGHR